MIRGRQNIYSSLFTTALFIFIYFSPTTRIYEVCRHGRHDISLFISYLEDSLIHARHYICAYLPGLVICFSLRRRRDASLYI